MSAAVREPPPAVDTGASRFKTRCFPAVPAPVKVEVATFQTDAGIVARSDELAVCTSESVAKDPAESPAPVKVLVPFVQTSAASVPKPVRVRVPAAQTAVAVSEASVPKVVSERVVAVQTLVGIVRASEVEAVLVFAFTSATTEEDADWISDKVASEPAESPAPVNVRVPDVQTSAASVPNVVSDRDAALHTAVGMVAASEVVAVCMSVRTAVAISPVLGADDVATTNVSDCFTKSIPDVPHFISAGNFPCVVVEYE
jgi:hypothetical protein